MLTSYLPTYPYFSSTPGTSHVLIIKRLLSLLQRVGRSATKSKREGREGKEIEARNHRGPSVSAYEIPGLLF